MKKSVIFTVAALLFSSVSYAYELNPEDWLLHIGVGPSVNLVREEATSKKSPGAGLLFSADLEYMLDDSWSALAGVRPMLTPGFVDMGFSVGAKYRWTKEVLPFIPFASVSVTPAILLPLSSPGTTHFNVGLRPTVGCDYFVMRNLAVGVELALEPSLILISGADSWFEFTVDFLFGATWKF